MQAAFDDLLRLKLRQEERKNETAEIEVDGFDRSLLFVCPSRDVQLDYIAALGKSGGDRAAAYDAHRELIYQTCPALRDPRLINEIGCADPLDVVDALLPPLEVIRIAEEITDKFFTLKNDLKNS